MWTTQTGHVLRLSPARVDALASLAEASGARRYLGVPLGACRRCSRSALFARIAQLAPRAAFARVLPPRPFEARSTLFLAREGGRTYRIVAEAIGDGQYAVESVDTAKVAAPAPRNLDRVEAIEERW